MARVSRPRAFISYRHVEHESGNDAEELNRHHRAWVEAFVGDLSACGVDAVFDGHMRDLFRPLTSKDPGQVQFLAELSSIGCLICHAFIPILTPSYIDRLGYAGYQRRDGAAQSFAFEEWQLGTFYCNAGVMLYVPVIRAGEPERMAELPLGVGPENTFDMRDQKVYRLQLQFIAQRILDAWDGEPPLITVDLADWMKLYINWCRDTDPRCAATPVDTWAADLLRPRLFLDHVLKPKGIEDSG